ncbi:DUF4227 family protein [Paenibacillus yanchengensis]|uniref:DUF4227 family protein n=1 Tax=Paenibacillus yanchengensis TaxID=2035833 RepID=A0ABW4YK65_9BACL
MIISLKMFWKRIVFFVVFICLVLVVSGGYHWLFDLMSPLQSNKLPRGEAVKVFTIEQVTLESNNIIDRLRLFYWYGQ